MKKSTRFLALLLCLVMVATLMPTFAMADVGTTVVDNKGVGKDIFTLSKDRYTINVNPGFIDTGYGYETTYLFPRTETSSVKTFTITRDAHDYNRWWRWAKDGDVLNQRQTNEESGYVNHSGTPGVDGWTAKIKWKNGWGTNKEMTIVKDGSREQKFIASKPLLSPQPKCFLWNGGYTEYAAKVEVSIERCKPLGTKSILWSANGTQPTQITAYSAISGISDNNQRVYYGDLGQNFMVIAEPRYVTYQLDGGNMNGDPNNQQYVVWTTGTASTSQKHKVISDVPSKENMIFDGWYCVELNKLVVAGSDLNNGITANMTLIAQWKNDVEDPDYYISFDGNGNTNTNVQMDNQKMEFGVADALSSNKYIQEYTVTYNPNNGECEEKSAVAASAFLGWGTSADSGAVYGDRQEVKDLTDVRDAVVPLWAQWKKGSVVLPTPHREPGENDDSVVAYVFEGWYDGDTLVGMGGDVYTPGKNVELKAKWTEVKDVSFYVYHEATGKLDAYNIKDYAEVKTDSNKQPYINKYKGTFNITDKVTEGYLYGGTFNSDLSTVADFNGVKGNTDGSPFKIYPEIGKTYYIHEVSEEHLVPKNISVWSKNGGVIDVTAVYLLTAIDREKYSAAGFQVSSGEVKQVSSEGKIAYEYINVWQNNKDYHYIDLYPAATTTANSLIQCCALTGFAKDQPITVVPYWVTLDGVKVFGTTQRTITYLGEGYNAVDVADADYTVAPAAANAVYSRAPMMLMARYSMANEESFIDVSNLPEVPDEPEVPDAAVVNVVDGDKAYEVEIVDGAIALTPAGVGGKLFAGWFVDAAFTTPADLAAVSDGDTVYAKYVPAGFLQMKYVTVFTPFNKTVSFSAAVADKNFAETGFVIKTKNGTDTVAVSSYTAKFALQNAQQLFDVAKNAPLMTVDYKLNGLSKGDTITVTPYWVTADGTTVYGTARTLTYNGLTVRG